MADESKNNGATGNEGAGDGGQKKVEFQPEQQTKVNELIDGAFSKAFGKAKQEYEPRIAALTAEIEKLKAGGKGKDEGKKDGQGEDLSAMKAEVEKLKAERLRDKELAKTAHLMTAASELNAVNGEQVAMLVSPYVKLAEDGKLMVTNPEGQTRFNAQGQPMSVKELVNEFLTANTHLVKAGGGAGAGSQGARFNGGAGAGKIQSVDDVRNMSTEELKKAISDGVSVPGSGGQVYHFKTNENLFKK